MIPLTDPNSTYQEDWHEHVFFDQDGTMICTIEFDALEEGRNGSLDCDLIVTWHLGDKDAPPTIIERVNLKARSSGNLNRVIKGLLDNKAMLADWESAFNIVVPASILHYISTSSIDGWMEWVEATADDTPFLLYPWVASSGTTVLFGPPGSNKSMFVLLIALTLARDTELFGHKGLHSGPVIYVDFEDERRPQELRFTAMARSLGLEPKDLEGLIYHVRVTKSMKAASRRIRRLVRELGAVLVIVDSIGRARGSDVSSSEATIKLFEQLAGLHCPVLAVDHMTKEDNKRVWTQKFDAREAMPIGSVYTHASTRLAWFMNVLPGATSTLKKYNLYNTKHNHVAEQTTRGMTFKAESFDFHALKNVEFTMSEMGFYVPPTLQDQTKAHQLLLWHFKEQRAKAKVTPFTLTEMKASGINPSTIRGIVTEKPASMGWWRQVPGSKQYVLTDEALEVSLGLAEVGDEDG